MSHSQCRQVRTISPPKSLLPVFWIFLNYKGWYNMCALIDHQEFSKCNNCFFFRSARPGLEPERPAAAPLSSSTSLGWEMSKKSKKKMVKKIKENRKEEKFSFKGEVHQSNGTVWPAWWDVRRHFKANILKRWQYNSPTEMNFVWLILRNFSSRSIDMRTKSKQLLAKNLQQTQVPQMSPSIRLVGKPLYWG